MVCLATRRWLEGFAYPIGLGPEVSRGGCLAQEIVWLTTSWQANLAML